MSRKNRKTTKRESKKIPLIFLSHSSTTQEKVEQLKKYLEDNGFNTWYSKEDIGVGKVFDIVIPPKIAESDALVILFCEAADKSKHVRRELFLADKDDKHIFTVRIQAFEPDKTKYYLSEPQYIDWFTDDNTPLQKLVNAIRNELKIETPPQNETHDKTPSQHKAHAKTPSQNQPEKPQNLSLTAKFILALTFIAAIISAGIYFIRENFNLTQTIKSYEGNVFELASNGTPEQIKLAINSGANFDVMSKDNNTPFIIAVLNNSHKESVKLLINQLNPLTKQSQLDNAMHRASSEVSNLEIIKLLAEEGANFYRGSYDTDKPLFMAAMYNSNPEVTKFFLEAESSDIQKTFLNGNFAAQLLASAATANSSNIKVAEYLINAGINVNAQDEDGVTALMSSAFAAYSPEMIQLLIDAGADTNIQDNTGKTALIYAANNSVWKIAEVLINGGADVDIADNDGKTALIYAAEKFGEKEAKRKIIAMLVKAKANIHFWDNNGKDAFDYASENEILKDDIDVLRMLNPFYMRNSEDVPADNNALIFELASKGKIVQIKRAINLGYDFNISSDWNATPLHYAARNNPDPEIIKLLIENGLDINGEDKQENTPLIYAIRGNNNLDVVKTLLEAGVYTDISRIIFEAANSHNRSTEVFKFLFNSEDNDTRELLLKGYLRDNRGRSLLQCAFYNGLDFLKFLLESGADTEQKDDDGNTVLMMNYYFENVFAKKILLDFGANVNAKNIYGQTALMRSAGLAGEVELFLKHKAEVNAQDNNGKTALMHAAEWCSNNWKNLDDEEISEIKLHNPSYFMARSIRLLLNAGADINLQNNNGKRAIDFMDKKLLLKFNPLLLLMLTPEDKREDEIFDFAEVCSSANLEDAINMGIPFNIKDKMNSTPLHKAAAKNDDVYVISLFVSQGLDVNAQDINGTTALIEAARNNSPLEKIESLIEAGADINICDNEGKYPIDFVSSESIIKLLKR